MTLSYTFVKLALQAAGLVPKGRARGRHRRRRPPRACFGELLHLDGSDHEWLARCPKQRQTLLAVIDDATKRLLYAQLCLGLGTIYVSLQHLDGHEMVKFMTWAQGILTLQPGVSALIADVHPIFKAHLFLGMTIFLVFPFTRLVHIWSAPVWYLGRRGYQIVRSRGSRASRGASAEYSR